MQLVDITKENFWDILFLTTNETVTVKGSREPYEAKGMPSLCEEFVASNALSIVQSVYENGWIIKAIEHEGGLIGFAMFGEDEETERCEICRIMIDRRYQNRGFGTRAIGMILEEMKSRFRCGEVYLSTDPKNERGLHVYHKLGFLETGEMDDGEAVLKLILEPEAQETKDSGVCELADTAKAVPLFEQWKELDVGVVACLQKVMGKIFVTDPEDPKSAMAVIGDFIFLTGEPDLRLLRGKPDRWVLAVPQNDEWAKLIEDHYPAYKRTRYAIKKDTRFDREKLEGFVKSLPEGYELRKIDAELYDVFRKNEDFEDCVSVFGSKEKFLELGRGFAVMKDGKIAAAASSYSRYREGIDIEIGTVREERQKGLGAAVAAKLILSCLDEGLYPAWDAANRMSVHLAEKLGYEFSHEYAAYAVE